MEKHRGKEYANETNVFMYFFQK